MPLDKSLISQLAHQFILAEKQRKPIDPITLHHPDLTTDDAYRINATIIEEKLKSGDKIVGMKIGATGQAIQRQMGIDEPLRGYLLESYRVADGGTIPRAQLIAPRVECEVAFLLGDDLSGPDCTVDDVLAATEAVMASIEVVDTRTRDWQVGLREIVADSLILAGFVLSERLVPVKDLNLPDISVMLSKNGEVVSRATGAEVLGNPANALVWLANKLYEQGDSLEAGQVVLSGSLTPLCPVDGRDTVEAVFEELGGVSVQFV